MLICARVRACTCLSLYLSLNALWAGFMRVMLAVRLNPTEPIFEAPLPTNQALHLCESYRMETQG